MVGLQTFNFAIPPLAFSFLRPQCRCPLYPQKRTCGAASGYGNSRLSAEATHLPRRSIICETRSFDQYRERRGPAPVSLCASNRCPRVRRLSAVQSSAEACRRRQLLQPPAARMELPRRPVSPLGQALAKAAVASPARRTTVRQSRHRSPIRSVAPSSLKLQ